MTITCTATTRLTAEECLQRLADCPALPRGERGATVAEVSFRKQWAKMLFDMFPRPVESEDEGRALWRSNASCVRRLREERRALKAHLSAAHTREARLQREMAAMTEHMAELREVLADVIGPPCEKAGRYCLTHQTKDCRADEARKLLGGP